MIRKIFFGFMLFLLVIIIWQYELVSYGISQARGQIHIMLNAKPVGDFLADPDYPDSLKQKLRLVQDIRNFSFDNLGLNPSDNYTTMFDQKGEELMWVVSACEPYRFESKVWRFPLIGTFSYKGFFDKERAYKLKEHLEAEGYDTGIGNASGWSTLGYLKDPILSNMLFRSDGRLAELIIHELTHGTLFVKDSLQFNENLATFIGIKGSIIFLEQKYGEDAPQLVQYEQYWHDKKLFTQHVLKTTHMLDSLYTAMDELYEDEVKEILKQQTITSMVNTLDTLGLYNFIGYQRMLQNEDLNNSFFMGYVRYRADLDLLEEELAKKYQGNIKQMLEGYKKIYPTIGN